MTASAPKPRTTLTPEIVSSTTDANSADSRWMPMTAGWSRVENLRPRTFSSGRLPSASRVRSGSIVARIRTTPTTVTALAAVSGISTTTCWSCWRSVLARLISSPVCMRSWYSNCRRMICAYSRSRTRVSASRDCLKAWYRRRPVKSAATTAATSSAKTHRMSAWVSSASMPRSMARRTSIGTLILARVQAIPAPTPTARPRHWSRTIPPNSCHPRRRAASSSAFVSSSIPSAPAITPP